MKIKHWQGYGTVTAKKLSSTTVNNGSTTLCVLRILVTGEHEWGIVCTDECTVANWLVKKFDKNFTDVRNIANIATNANAYGDSCEYIITYRKV